eukprot:388967-Ditylum_brightwellii.AAC.1
MSTATRSIRLITGSKVNGLVGLDSAHIRKLEDDYSITSLQDLALLDKQDVDTILGTDANTFLVRRKLFMVADFLRKGIQVSISTTMNGVVTLGSNSMSPGASSSAKSSTPIKLSPADFPSFSGKIENQKTYKTKAEAQIGQTAFKFLLTQDAVGQEDEERDKELFNVFKSLFLGGKAYNVITQLLVDDTGDPVAPTGRKVWENFLQWCNSG